MTQNIVVAEGAREELGPDEAHRKFTVCIEGREIPWKKGTITFDEIIDLGGWDPSKGVVEVDEDQGERTLESGEIVKLKPGLRFGKKVRFKRG